MKPCRYLMETWRKPLTDEPEEHLIRYCMLDDDHVGVCQYGPWFDADIYATITVTKRQAACGGSSSGGGGLDDH